MISFTTGRTNGIYGCYQNLEEIKRILIELVPRHLKRDSYTSRAWRRPSKELELGEGLQATWSHTSEGIQLKLVVEYQKKN